MKPNIIVINSKDRLYGTSSNFDIQFNVALSSVKALKLLSAQIPNSIYNVKSTNNILYINTIPVIIPQGAYNITSLVTSLQNVLNAAGFGILFTITYSDITLKLTISATGPFSVTDGINSINALLGFQISGPSNSKTGSNIVNLAGDIYYYLCIDVFNNQIKSSNSKDYGAYVIPTQVASGGITQFRINTDFPILETTTQNINKINISVKGYDGSYIDFNGADLVLIFEVHYCS